MDIKEFKALFDQCPQKYPFIFEKRHPTAFNMLLTYWDVPIEADAYFDKLINAAANLSGSSFAADAKMDLISIRDAFKQWRLNNRPRAPISVLKELGIEMVPSILNQLQAPTPQVSDAMKIAFELASSNSDQIVDFLRSKNLLVNQRNIDGFTPLMACAQKGSEVSAISLIKAGANPHIYDSMGNTALHWAVMQNRRRIAEMLLYFGANPNTPNSSGATAYTLSVVKEDSTIAQRLYEYGADISTQDQNGNTPLHKAIGSGSIENVWLLLQAGAIVNARNKFGVTPTELAEKKPDILRIFDKHNIDKRTIVM